MVKKLNKKIILIENDFDNIEVYELALKRAGFDVEVLSFEEDVFKKIQSIKENKEQKPDMIITTMFLDTRISGITITNEIRKYPETKDIKVLIWSSYSKNELQVLGYSKEVASIENEKFVIKAEHTPTEIIKMIKEELGIN